jgi:hypothetical protein
MCGVHTIDIITMFLVSAARPVVMEEENTFGNRK